MEVALSAVTEGRAHLVVALDLLEKRRDCPDDTQMLREIVGDLAAIVDRWRRERARWQ
jgi:hypothetical protein